MTYSLMVVKETGLQPHKQDRKQVDRCVAAKATLTRSQTETRHAAALEKSKEREMPSL